MYLISHFLIVSLTNNSIDFSEGKRLIGVKSQWDSQEHQCLVQKIDYMVKDVYVCLIWGQFHAKHCGEFIVQIDVYTYM